MKDFRRLMVWQKAHQLTLNLYGLTNSFPASELYGLTSQLRRASSSIPANIAEGCGRDGDRDFARFLQMAMGSASEVDYHLILARDLGFLSASHYASAAETVLEVKRMLSTLIRKVRSGTGKG